MKKSEVTKLLEENINQRGIDNWNEMEADKCNLKSYGMGLTVHRKLAKQIGKDHELAKELWNSDYYDHKVISVLVDDPKKITIEQMEEQVKDLDFGYMVHVYSACGAPVAKTPFIAEVALEWAKSDDSIKRRCANGFIYELSKLKTKKAPDDDYFLDYVDYVEKTFPNEPNSIRMSFATALMGIGKRNAVLNKAALKVAKAMGPVPVETGKTNCEPFDVVKHLTTDYLKKRLGI